MDSLFGSAPSTETTSQPALSSQQNQFLNLILSKFTDQLNTGAAGGPATYSGPFAAPLSNLQNLSLSAIENLSKEMGSSQTYQAANDALLKQLQTGGKQDITDTFQNSVVQPFTKQFSDVILPQITGNFAGNAAYGSDKQKQEQLALSDLSKNILNAGSALSFQAGNSANTNILTALGLEPTIGNQTLDAQIKALAAGGVPQQVEQSGIANQLQYLTSQNQNKTQNLAAMLAALGISPFNNTTVAQGGSSGILPSLIGAGGNFAGSQAGSSLISQFFGGGVGSGAALAF